MNEYEMARYITWLRIHNIAPFTEGLTRWLIRRPPNTIASAAKKTNHTTVDASLLNRLICTREMIKTSTASVANINPSNRTPSQRGSRTAIAETTHSDMKKPLYNCDNCTVIAQGQTLIAALGKNRKSN